MYVCDVVELSQNREAIWLVRGTRPVEPAKKTDVVPESGVVDGIVVDGIVLTAWNRMIPIDLCTKQNLSWTVESVFTNESRY